MENLIILAVGFIMNFLVGYGAKGYFFRTMLPKPRAIYTALLSYFVCVGASAFGGYLVLGPGGAIIGFTTVALLYAIPALLHFLLLYYQFNMDWTVTDEEEAEQLAQEEAKASRRVATIKSSGDED